MLLYPIESISKAIRDALDAENQGKVFRTIADDYVGCPEGRLSVVGDRHEEM